MNSTSPDALRPPCGYTAGLQGYRPGGTSRRAQKGKGGEDMAILTEKSWKRHSNPWSVWTRILSYPLAYVPVWNRSWKQGAVVGAWFTANPVIFPHPRTTPRGRHAVSLGNSFGPPSGGGIFLWRSTPRRLCSTQVRCLRPTGGAFGLRCSLGAPPTC